MSLHKVALRANRSYKIIWNGNKAHATQAIKLAARSTFSGDRDFYSAMVAWSPLLGTVQRFNFDGIGHAL